ncbi:carboxypeptidase regulatory-like domain-containing protein [Streptomyces sp. NBC_00365]|uniref:kelch repeat-containing protein n=1 Tax=Streptomyces sp. NBC_00365 TaxID=2975726 RepID=UPI002252007B|nr:kelch repeat-containing protein [Streptomyces sp. NBC_00365]MCX5093886.1 carboxypeptidase regulatory-like domain-containing protein [Streptomyces sp. NBC_00365]
MSISHRPVPRRRRGSAVGAALLSAVLLTVLGAQAQARADVPEKAAKPPSSTHEPPGHVAPLCGPAKPHELTCFGLLRTDVKAHKGLRAAEDAPEGFGPADLLSAYGLPADGGAGKTIAIVDAYDNPNAEADLAVYRAQYGLPACTTADGCFTKVDQRGGTTYPAPDPGWATEISLDLDMVSAVAPNARILLVEADEATADDLGSAVDQAVALGATYVSNSYGTNYAFYPEDPAESSADAHYDHPGVVIVASSGDSRYGVSYPAASPHVTAVGGTTLTKDSTASRGWSESVWSHDGGGTGSGCSLYEPKPAFQKDTGCPGRTVADVSAVADPATGVAVYDSYGESGGWGVAGGTSASAPIIAGVYANAGTPVAGTYPDAYPYAGGGSGLHDVTTGSNGKCSPAYLCTAGTGYDGPTGLGTPDGLSSFRMGAHGTLSGTVTDTATGAPVAAAEVTAGVYTATTDSQGRYTLPLPAGSHDVQVTVYGYASGEAADVQVTDGGAVNRDFGLRKLAVHRVSGTVTDGSGHGWPLHAKITVEGVPGVPVWSDAYTGAYHLDLPENHTYTLRVVSDDTHYQSLVRKVAVKDADQSLGLALPVDTWAGGNPAYTLKVNTLDTQSFDSAAQAPKGWSVVDVAGTGHGWAFDDPGGRGNNTGGSGGFAVADNDHVGWDTALDTLLVSPVYDLRHEGVPELAFSNDYEGSAEQTGDVQVTADGGKTWTTVWHMDDAWSFDRVEIPLTAYAGKAAVQVRFHYTGPGKLWAVDDVTVAERVVTPVRGGVLTGTVTDANTGHGLVGAVVRTGTTSGPSAPTVATTGDPRVGDGLYRLFVRGGARHTFVASKPSYGSASHTVAVAENHVTKGSFVLKAGRLSAGTTRIAATTAPHGTVVRKVTVRNTGTAPATLRIGERTGTGPGTGTPGTTWRGLPDLPVVVMDNAVESYRGKIYSVFGSSDGYEPIAGLYVYNPSAHTWTRGTSAPEARMATVHGVIGGRLYTVGGQGPGEAVSRTMQVYDPAHNTWTKGPSMPKGRFGAASSVLDGRLYAVGGCTNTGCSNSVYVFDPGSGKWSRAADYPQSIGWASCGAINGRLYCAGGSGPDYAPTTASYVYDPASNSWQPLADMPMGLAGSTYAAADGRLLVSGGATLVGAARVATPKGYAYDPGTNTWSTLPDAPTAVYRGGGALGLYRVGGTTDTRWYIPTATAALLPGYDQTESDVPWLSENPHRLTLRPGQSASFTVTLLAGKMGRPGDWTASLILRGDTPYWVPPIPVRVHIVKDRTP